MEHNRPRQSVQRFSSQLQKSSERELFSDRGANLRCAIGERQDHVALIEFHALLVVGFPRDVPEWKSFQALTQFFEALSALAPMKHARMRSICEIEFAGRGVECAGDHRGQA